ncbi:MAG: Asp-tRNA(Asn)/Glu-tRNA(Gln) amidotransferase subunit GatA [Candidatus Bathyarchaeota archaeon]|nr:Asp-tRNA(Asn)/Glu-tRNA(Gln) amidotransferase subunit GatA [Candidatus Bathyarchaeota archaeon]
MDKLFELTAFEIAQRIKNRELSALEYINALLQRINDIDPEIHAFLTVTEDMALKKAKKIDAKLKHGEKLGKLCGVGMAVKDNICTKDIKTTCSSKALENFIPPYNATVVDLIEKEDAIILGKTNMDEFAMGSSTEFSYFGPTLNPLDISKVPGGSSGGSAAAVASNEATVGLGSDTGGSVRCPASFCGVVGLKPTYGLVSRYGLIAYANSLEQISPITKDVRDLTILLECMIGHDKKDSTSLNSTKVDYSGFLKDHVKGLKIGVPKQFFGEGTDDNISKNVWNAIHTMNGLGADFDEISIESLDYALASYYIIAISEASSNLARYDGIRYGFRIEDESQDWDVAFSKNRKEAFGQEVKRRIILGTYALSAGYYNKYYLKAQKVRTLIKTDFEKVFAQYDILVGPTMPILPFKLGEKTKDPLEMYMCDLDTVPANLTGTPAISIPCGSHNDLPIGIQFMTKPFNEGTLIQTSYTLEQSLKK